MKNHKRIYILFILLIILVLLLFFICFHNINKKSDNNKQKITAIKKYKADIEKNIDDSLNNYKEEPIVHNLEKNLKKVESAIFVNNLELKEDSNMDVIETDEIKANTDTFISDNNISNEDNSISNEIKKIYISLLVSENQRIGLITSSKELLYKDYNEEIIKVSSDGIISALKEGETNINIYSKEDKLIEAEIIVKVDSDKIKSDVYIFDEAKYDSNGELENSIKVLYGFEEETKYQDIINNINNDKELLKVYDSDGNIIKDLNDFIKTGMVLKLEENNIIYDEVVLILLGDINKDGKIDESDKIIIQNQIFFNMPLDILGYYAADLNKDGLVDISDNVKLNNYLINKIPILDKKNIL